MAAMTQNYYALIMAGGGGTRLWPLSRQNRPKQSLSLVEEDTMFRISVERLFPLFGPDRIFVVTGANMLDDLRADAPEIPAENYIVEPFGQDSGPAAGLGTAHIYAKDPQAIIAVLTSDHYIEDVAGFRQALEVAAQTAANGHIVTLGITPHFPSTAFGYIERGEQLTTDEGLTVYHSNGFREKPDEETARRFVESGRYSWNAGMFIWKAEQALAEFRRQQPMIYKHLAAIHGAYGTADYRQAIEGCWPKMTKISVDYAIMEHAQNVTIIPVDIGWSDIGSWSTLYDLLTGDTQSEAGQNITRGEDCELIAVDTTGTLVVSERTVVMIGLDDMVVVDTDDVLMICPRDRAQEVRGVVKKLRQMGHEDLL